MSYTKHNFETGDILYASQLNEMDDQIAANEEAIENSVSSDMLAEDYSANKTYSIGDYVIYNNELYTCIYEITAPEGWNSSHWSIANLGDGISELNRQLSDVENDIDDAFIKSVNLFDKNEVVPNKVLKVGSGETIESMIDSEVLYVSPIIPIEAGQYVCNSLFDNSTIRFNAYDADGRYLGGTYGIAQADGSYIFNIVGVDPKQGRFTYRPTTLNVDTFMFVKGSTLPPEYQSYGIWLNPAYVTEQIQTALDNYEIPDGSVTPTKTSFVEHDPVTNLIDKNSCVPGYIKGDTDGSVISSSTFYATSFVPLKENTQYYFNYNYLYRGYYAFYNADKVRISGGGSDSSDFIYPPFTTPLGTAYGRFTILSQAALANAWLCETNQMTEKPTDYAEQIQTKFISERPTDHNGEDIGIFTKILCIGDSLTDGFFNESGGSRLIMRKRSYPTKLQELTGVECTNMGYAGYTSAQWYAEYSSTDLSGHDACIIQLGVNDALNNVSESDMDSALINIINKVKNENAGIKIFVATIVPANGYMTVTMRERSQMIRNFVNNLSDPNVYLIDLWEYGHTADFLAYDAGHLSAYGYWRLAMDYKAYISFVIHNNPNDFRYVQFIGTNYSFVGDSTTRQITY